MWVWCALGTGNLFWLVFFCFKSKKIWNFGLYVAPCTSEGTRYFWNITNKLSWWNVIHNVIRHNCLTGQIRISVILSPTTDKLFELGFNRIPHALCDLAYLMQKATDDDWQSPANCYFYKINATFANIMLHKSLLLIKKVYKNILLLMWILVYVKKT